MARHLRYAARSTATLDRNTAHTFAAGYALSLYDAEAVYSLIPKNGCSTVRLSLAIANGAIAGPQDINWIHHNNFTFSASRRELVTARYTFAILRCPFARLASCYLDKIVGRNFPFWKLDHLLGRTLDPNAYTFRRFVEALTDEEVRDGDEHWRPQHDFLVYEDYDDLFDLADFGTIRRTLSERIGLTLVDARSHTRHGIDGLARVAGCGPDTAPLDILVMRSRGEVPEPASLYDADLIATVAALYADDLALMRARYPQSVMFDALSAGAGTDG